MSLMRTSPRTVTEKVISRVAEAEGVDERELRRPLYDVVDPDALNDIFRDGRGEVSFEYVGYAVTISYGAVTEVDVSPVGGD
jgi:hypothetical protein